MNPPFPVAGPTSLQVLEAVTGEDLKDIAFPGVIDPHTHWGNFGDLEGDCVQESQHAAMGDTTTALLFQKVAASGRDFTGYETASLDFDKQRSIGDRVAYVNYGFNPIVHDEVTAAEILDLAEKCGSPAVKFYMAYRLHQRRARR
ncbi:hypothetical protein [Aliihoeflea sp. 40Bstr573]|uniref:hypothetical protein n=1 Tax=Aliihoeflea sp. 40Bstr573 TaxID=2696467 RepID=UPI002096084C|nr:hypothetical protein [Aliihoeflea sp. 40Bstr573]MCO6387770.1 hypothetical protein [Aliihoeflea sp. 40Bstr573]